MTEHSFRVSVLVDASPEAAYQAILRPQDWWGREIEGAVDLVGEEWTYRYKDMHRSRQTTTELTPGKRVVWNVVDCEMTFLTDRQEWTGTRLIFDLEPEGDKTLVRFTHDGLGPNHECYEICSSAWAGLIADSLKRLIETGQGLPDTVEKAAA